MRIDEIADLSDVLKSEQYIKLLHRLKTKHKDDIKAGRIKNMIIQSWKKGQKSRKHYANLLGQIDINLNDLIG